MTNWELCKIYFKGAILELNPTFVVKVQNTVKKIREKTNYKFIQNCSSKGYIMRSRQIAKLLKLRIIINL